MVWMLAPALVLLAGIDLRTGRLPNVLTLPLLGVCAVVAAAEPLAGAAALVAAAPYLGGFLTGQCGGGDVKLAACCGTLLGAPAVALTAVLGAAVLTVAGCGLTRRGRLPHGPALVAATLAVAVVAGG